MLKMHRARNARKGATVVEFAIVLPVMLLILFGCIELALANMIVNTTEAAAYEAARVAILPGSNAQESIGAARRILGTAGIRVADVSLNPSNLGTRTNTVTVTISAKFQDNLAIPTLFVEDRPIIRTCVLRRERVN